MNRAHALIAGTLGLLLAAGPAAVAQVPAATREVALTFDDLPMALPAAEGAGVSTPGAEELSSMREATSRLLATLAAHGAPAIGFVNESRLHVVGERDARVALLQMWLDAGMTLGNHTFSHMDLQSTPLARYEDDVIQGEVVTRGLMREKGLAERYFRHPYTHTGPTKEVKQAFEAFLHERGYVVAPFTVEHVDYVFNALYLDARTKRDEAITDRVRRAYLDHLGTMFSFFEGLSREVFEREIPQILLIHANALNAVCLDDMLRRLEERGYRFVTLDRALEDPAYRTPDDFVASQGISWLHRFKVALGKPLRFEAEPDPPDWVLKAYKALRPAWR